MLPDELDRLSSDALAQTCISPKNTLETDQMFRDC